VGDTNESYKLLMQSAQQAMQRSYSPYSKFPVGAALLTDDGRVFTGCNIEDASFSAGICAERTALVKAVSEGFRKFKAIAITSKKGSECYPCGTCRQFLSEFGIDLDLLIDSKNGNFKVVNLRELLPKNFGPTDLTT
jgi:cytidine deaminase